MFQETHTDIIEHFGLYGCVLLIQGFRSITKAADCAKWPFSGRHFDQSQDRVCVHLWIWRLIGGEEISELFDKHVAQRRELLVGRDDLLVIRTWAVRQKMCWKRTRLKKNGINTEACQLVIENLGKCLKGKFAGAIIGATREQNTPNNGAYMYDQPSPALSHGR